MSDSKEEVKGRVCGHSQLPQELGSIDPILPGRKLKVQGGIIYWHLTNVTPDLSKYKIINSFEKAWDIWEDVITPIRFKPTADPRKAVVSITFATNEGPTKPPSPFSRADGTLAYAYAPDRFGRTSIWVDDHYDWEEELYTRTSQDFSIVRTVCHEMGHCLGLGHLEGDMTCLMAPIYSESGPIKISPASKALLRKIYGLGGSKPPVTPTDAPETPASPDLSANKAYLRKALKAALPNEAYCMRLYASQMVNLLKFLGISASQRSGRMHLARILWREISKG